MAHLSLNAPAPRLQSQTASTCSTNATARATLLHHVDATHTAQHGRRTHAIRRHGINNHAQHAPSTGNPDTDCISNPTPIAVATRTLIATPAIGNLSTTRGHRQLHPTYNSP